MLPYSMRFPMEFGGSKEIKCGAATWYRTRPHEPPLQKLSRQIHMEDILRRANALLRLY